MKSIPKNPIIDTGPIFDFLILRFSESFKTVNLTYRYLKNDYQKKAILWYLNVAKPVTTCPHVITEIHRHAEQNLRGQMLGNFWRLAQKELVALGLCERLVELVQMDGDILSSFGPADTALLHLATMPYTSNPIFTEDGKLKGECRRKEISFLGIDEVLSIWQQFGSK